MQRGPDAFLLYWEGGTRPDGRRKQRTETFHSEIHEAPAGKSLQEARRAAAEDRWMTVHLEIVRGTDIEPDKVTVAQLCERWYRDVFLLRSPAEQTKAQYETTIKLHIAPGVGHVRVQSLTTQQVQAMIAGMTRKDGRPGEPSARQRRLALVLLRQILRQAEIWQIVHRNVASFAEAPKGRRRPIQYWRADEVETFLDAARGHRLYGLFALALASGMRISELLGLRRDAIDWSAGSLYVRAAITQVRGKMVESDLKTSHSRRVIALGPATMEMLTRHLERVDAERAQEDREWRDEDLVFPSEVGTPLGTRNVERAFDAIQKRAGVRRITIHGLRHTHATQLLAAGVQAHVVSQRLGHASVAFTLSVYAHVLPHQQDLAARVMDFGEQGSKSGNIASFPRSR